MPEYKNPPIIEAVCEFRFTEDTEWDITIPGLVFESVRDQYPQKERRVTQEISILTSKKHPGRARSEIKKEEFAVFLTNDKKTSIHVGPGKILLSQLKPYHTWDDFKSRILEAFDILNEKVEVKGIQRIGLRFINLIEIPTENNQVNLDKYFDFRPYCGTKLPQSHGEFIIGCIFPYFEQRDLCRVELTSSKSEMKDAMAFLLNIDYFLNKPKSISVDEIRNWVEDAHGEVENLFEGCILDPLRQIFQEVEEV